LTLILTYSPLVPPEIIPFQFGSDIVSGEQVNLQCTSTKGDLPIQFHWSYQSSDLNPSNSQNGVSIIKMGPRTSALIIAEVNANRHIGHWTCSASSPSGVSNFTAELKEVMGNFLRDEHHAVHFASNLFS
jgi:hypothetical protein